MFSSTFKKLSNASEKKLLILAITTFLLAGTCMVQFDTLLKTAEAPLGIISYELAQSVDNADKILSSWNAIDGAMKSAEWSLWFDYIFIITYVSLLCLLLKRVLRFVWTDDESQRYKLGIVLIRMVIFAGILDIVENFALLQMFYNGVQSHWANLAFVAAMLKFMKLALAILYVLVGFIFFLFKKNRHVKK
ncbi:hypothetical protein [Kordia jejudonensis]|uniref:hypothetical protein n=1 Tax=Kordia jejudonensis TaxID=1348245 RepID=UPI00069AF713|nr:hypothetical protein [Kordia jejudonensis]